ncbi:putative cysteine protease inhibitor (Staphostatin A) [Staphylococcus aureus]|nr:putative cysteine protease inhibitor (Staphostatin A) [Staphylococcus aureus]
MEQIELFSIDKFKCNSEAKYYLNIIEGEWHPQDLNDSPLNLFSVPQTILITFANI